jgi:hypothetical protein
MTVTCKFQVPLTVSKDDLYYVIGHARQEMAA